MSLPKGMTASHILSFYYLVFAHITDWDLSTEEILKIGEIISKWSGLDPSGSGKVVGEALAYYVTIGDDPEKVSKALTSSTIILMQELNPKQYKEIIRDLVAIGKADGNFDDREKKYAKMIASQLEIDPAWVDAFT